MAPIHRLHEGELLLQKRKGTPNELTASMPNYIDRDMPQQLAEFYAGLPYLPLATLDSQGRPWASLLVTRSGSDPSVGVTVSGDNVTDVVAETNPYDPFVRALGQDAPSLDAPRLFAGVGVDFTNRRRNKLAGSIQPLSLEEKEKVNLRLISDQHLGNCPKYITVRSLDHVPRDADLLLDSYDTLAILLPETSKALIARTSTTFLATKHTAGNDEASNDQRDMGLNHRGGAPGFVRLFEDTVDDVVTTYLVLPDHSGNRFYQSLGNIETDRQVGLVFPDFVTGDMLYVTGNAENLHDADAEAIMPRVGLLTLIEVTGAVHVTGGLNLRLTSEEQHSPYNPPVKYLRSELQQMGHAIQTQPASDPVSATLVSTQALSDSISTFTFELSSAVEAPLPGGFGVFDFSGMLNAGYSHMNEANPQLVNEDYVRTWTLSGAPDFEADKNQFRTTNKVDVTVKRKPGGLMSNVLHEHADQMIKRQLKLEFKGSGAGFGCFSADSVGGPPDVPAKMLWIAGGVGITPFMSMWDGICNVAHSIGDHLSTDIVLLFSGRDDDIRLVKHFMEHGSALPDHVTLRLGVFQSVTADNPTAQLAFEDLRAHESAGEVQFNQKRIHISDLEAIHDLHHRDVFLCGPDSLMKWATRALRDVGVAEETLHRESFFF